MSPCSRRELALTTAVNVVASCTVVLLSKMLYHRELWPYPVSSAAVELLLVWYCAPPPPKGTDMTLVPIMGALFAANVGLHQVSLKLCSVGAYTLFTALQIPCVVVVQHLWCGVHEGRMSLMCAFACACFVAYGGMILTVDFTSLGLLAAIAGAGCTACAKVLVKATGVSDTDALFHAHLPQSVALLGIISIAGERPEFPAPPQVSPLYSLVIVVILVAVAFSSKALNLTGYRICKTSPLLYQLLGPIKGFVVVAYSNSWGSRARVVSIVGSALCATAYGIFRDKSVWAAYTPHPPRARPALRSPHLYALLAAACYTFGGGGRALAVQYRLSDYIRRCGFGSALTGCYYHPTSLGCIYSKSNNGPWDIDTLHTAVNRRLEVPDTSAVTIHTRLGDGLELPDCWNVPTNCSGPGETEMRYALPELYYTRLWAAHQDILKPGNRTIHVVYGYHGCATPACRADTDHYVAQMTAWAQAMPGNWSTVIRGNYTADDDLAFMSRSRVFVQGGGGYSAIAADLVRANGGTVLRLGDQVVPHKISRPMVYIHKSGPE